MFGQLLVYVGAARKRGEAIPAFLAVIDNEKAAIMPTERALPLFDDMTIVWPKSGSKAGRELAAQNRTTYSVRISSSTKSRAMKILSSKW